MSLARVAQLVLGATLLVAGIGKRASPTWPTQAAQLGAPRWAVPAIPVVELLLGAGLVAGLGAPWLPVAAAALLVVFTAVVVRALAGGRRPPCACFGGRATRPIGAWTVARNAALIAVAVVAAS